MPSKKKGCLSIVKWSLLGILVLVISIILIILWLNRSLPESIPDSAVLSPAEQALLAETTHLRRSLGNRVWPGWADPEIPLVVYNNAYVFLYGFTGDDPARGWKRVPHPTIYGNTWEKADQENYYRQPLLDPRTTPQAFIVQVGDQFAASMTSKRWTDIKMVRNIRSQVPGILKSVVPYTLILNQFNSDWYITALLHESFHAFQALRAYDKLVQSENSTTLESSYPWEEPAFRKAWARERRILAVAVNAQTRSETLSHAEQWLAVRTERRSQLPDELINYEKHREWLEGLAKYAEINIWEAAGEVPGFHSLDTMNAVKDFKHYSTSSSRIEQELTQLSSDLQFESTIFYYSGWAQAEMLDRLDLEWKTKIYRPGIYLEDLVRQSLPGNSP